MLGLRKPISIRYILWGHRDVCEYWARENNLRKTDYHRVAARSGERLLDGIEGPLRNPDTPYRLIIFPSGHWRPTERDLEYARARGFDLDKCVVRL